MRIAGIEKFSLVDYPGKVACALFTAACNMNCFYCHNRALLRPEAQEHCLEPQKLRAFLASRRGMLDGVVISGGEPTLHPDLPEFVEELRGLGYPVKIDTNGARPQALRQLVASRLVDYVSMDIKAPLGRYAEIAGAPVNIDAIEESMDLLLSGAVNYEFRTTVPPQLGEEDLLSIASRIRGARAYYLQQCRPPQDAESLCDPRVQSPPHSPAWLRAMAQRLSSYVQRCDTRGV